MNLLRLLKLEWSKFSPSGTFRVFAGLYLGSFALVVFLARSVGNNMTMTANGTLTHPMAGLMNYPNNWQLLACIGSWMNLFVLGSLGVFMITMEFGNRTLRQSVIFGMSRLEVAVCHRLLRAGAGLPLPGQPGRAPDPPDGPGHLGLSGLRGLSGNGLQVDFLFQRRQDPVAYVSSRSGPGRLDATPGARCGQSSGKLESSHDATHYDGSCAQRPYLFDAIWNDLLPENREVRSLTTSVSADRRPEVDGYP
jgi:hypothetical protein